MRHAAAAGVATVKAMRPLFFALLLVAIAACVFWMRWQGGPNGGGEAWLVPVGVLGAVYAAAVVIDVVVHAWKGQGQACRVCGHVRPVRSFRLEGPCPQCGE